MIATLNAENHIWYQQLSLCTLFHLTSPCTQTHADFQQFKDSLMWWSDMVN